MAWNVDWDAFLKIRNQKSEIRNWIGPPPSVGGYGGAIRNPQSAIRNPMEFDWLDSPFDLRKLTPREIEESFEDPFSLRLMPDVEIAGTGHVRYFNMGKSIEGRGIFTIFWSDGKKIRCILAREMTPEEQSFFERKTAELN